MKFYQNLIKKNYSLAENQVTDENVFNKRRQIISTFGAAGVASQVPSILNPAFAADNQPRDELAPLDYTKNSDYKIDEELNSFKQISSYNNFYEFSLDKEGPSELAHNLQTRPWSIVIDGECESPMTLDIEDLLSNYNLQERIYRFRCVEAWSMVIPWVGIPLNEIIKQAKPTSKAKYVSFETLHDPEQMPGQKPSLFGSNIDWPYREGLRIDEAMNDLTLISVGLYGKVLPNQNGAPLRLIVPWKYGFKSIKSIVRISFVESEPYTTWNDLAANEYGFYANVNPKVNHPRWSQAKERRVGEIFKIPTLLFNGYEDQVAHMYKDLDLKKFF